MAGDYPQYLRRASLAKAVDAGLAAVAMNRDFSRTILGPRHLLTSSDFTVTIHRQRGGRCRSEEHTSELQSLMRISYAVFCLKKKKNKIQQNTHKHEQHN